MIIWLVARFFLRLLYILQTEKIKFLYLSLNVWKKTIAGDWTGKRWHTASRSAVNFFFRFEINKLYAWKPLKTLHCALFYRLKKKFVCYSLFFVRLLGVLCYYDGIISSFDDRVFCFDNWLDIFIRNEKKRYK